MFAHFKCTGLLHTLHLMELLRVKLDGNFFKQMMQKSSSSEGDESDEDDWITFAASFFDRFAGVVFGSLRLSLAVFFSFNNAMLSGDVSTVLFIGLRPRFDFFFGVPFCNGPMSVKTELKLVERDNEPADVDGSFEVVTVYYTKNIFFTNIENSLNPPECWSLQKWRRIFFQHSLIRILIYTVKKDKKQT